MLEHFFYSLEQINNAIWTYLAFVLVLLLGGYFSVSSRFFQIRKFPQIISSFIHYFSEKKGKKGVHPIKVFFAAIGGCIGIGNIVGISTAIQIGGPGALFWTWIGGLMGMLIQYSEVYLGLKYRISNEKGSYDGGPMFFLPVAYRVRWVGKLVCFLLCIYSVEIFMFNVIVDSFHANWHVNKALLIILLLVATFAVALGGIKRIGTVCSAIIPLFVAIYLAMSLWILVQNYIVLPQVFFSIFKGAFTEQAAIGGFAGSSVALAISMGLSRGAYSGDIGIGYTSVIYAEGSSLQKGRQASLAVFGVFIDTFVICTTSLVLALTTGHWMLVEDPTLVVQYALGTTFPYMHFFMPFMIFLLGYTTILAYFAVGVKCAKFLLPKWGPKLYYLYAAIVLPLFAFVSPSKAFVIMSLSGAMLLLLNLIGIFLLKKEIVFNLD
jgi:AGCS family alanine or glycine:cation symporter